MKSAGFITGVPNKGSVVSNITSKEIKDIFELREIIEGFAVRQSMKHLTESDFSYLEGITRQMHRAHEQNDILNILELDMEFHGFFYTRCDNHMILELWNDMKMKVMRFMAISNRIHTKRFISINVMHWNRPLISRISMRKSFTWSKCEITCRSKYRMAASYLWMRRAESVCFSHGYRRSSSKRYSRI